MDAVAGITTDNVIFDSQRIARATWFNRDPCTGVEKRIANSIATPIIGNRPPLLLAIVLNKIDI